MPNIQKGCGAAKGVPFPLSAASSSLGPNPLVLPLITWSNTEFSRSM